MKTNTEKKLDCLGGVWGQQPILIVEADPKKENLTNNDIAALRYWAQELFCEEYTRDGVEEAAAVQDNELYLGDFEGYGIGEDLIALSIYLDEKNRVILSCTTPTLSIIDYLIS